MEFFFNVTIQETSNTLRTLLVLLLVVGVMRFVQYVWQRRRIYMHLRKMRMPPGTLPFIGHLWKLSGSAERLFRNANEYAVQYGPNFAFWMGNVPMIVIGKPEDIEIVLQSNKCIEKGFFYKFVRNGLGEGLLAAPVRKWKKNRKIIQSTFNSRILNNFSSFFETTSTVLIQEVLPKLVDKKNVDWYSVLLRTHLDSITQSVMGIDLDVQRKEVILSKHLQNGSNALFLRLTNMLLHPDFIFSLTKSFIELRDAMKYISNFAMNVVKEKRKELDEMKECEIINRSYGNNERKIFLEMLIEYSKNGNKFTDKEVIDEVINFITGGIDTSAVTTCFFLMVMGIHQDIQEKVHAEIIQVVGPHKLPDLEQLPKLNFLERCLKETMRLFSPVPSISREVCMEEVTLSNCTLPVGAVIVLPIFYTHRCSHYWENPMSFDPDRFLPEVSSKRHPYSYLPFSGGLRGCVGVSYTFMNLKILLCQIIRKYRIYCDYRSVEEVKLTNNIVLRPVHGFKINLEYRV